MFSHAGDGAQEVIFLPPHGTLTESPPQVLVHVAQLALKPFNVGFDVRTRTAMVAEALSRFFSETNMVITWCLREARELRTCVSPSRKGRTEGRTASAKWASTVCVKRVGLGKLPGGAGEVTHLARD